MFTESLLLDGIHRCTSFTSFVFNVPKIDEQLGIVTKRIVSLPFNTVYRGLSVTAQQANSSHTDLTM